MHRIFSTLSMFAIGLMVATALAGFFVGDLHAELDETTQARFRVHFFLGLASALGVVLVNSIGVTYFIGTSRWCREVVETYRLDPNLIAKSNDLKRRTFPWAVIGMLTVVGVIALGAAGDPGTGRANAAAWVAPHLIGAMAGIALVGLSFFLQAANIRAHHAVIEEIVAEVAKIRAARGLEA